MTVFSERVDEKYLLMRPNNFLGSNQGRLKGFVVVYQLISHETDYNPCYFILFIKIRVNYSMGNLKNKNKGRKSGLGAHRKKSSIGMWCRQILEWWKWNFFHKKCSLFLDKVWNNEKWTWYDLLTILGLILLLWTFGWFQTFFPKFIFLQFFAWKWSEINSLPLKSC